MENTLNRFVAILLLATLAPAAAFAQTQTYYHAGSWTAFSERDDKGTAVCGINNTSPADNRRLAIRFTIGGSDTAVIASKPNWAIPDGTHVPIVTQVGLNMPASAQAAGTGQDITWHLDHAAFQVFDNQFRTSPLMTVTFPDGNEPPWMIALTGSAAISETFARCVRDLTRQYQAAHAAAAAPAAPQTPTQPFAQQH